MIIFGLDSLDNCFQGTMSSNEFKDSKIIPITKSGFYKIICPSGNIHYAKYVRPGCFISGFNRDYRNGGHYPVRWPDKYIYLFGLNNKWEPDERVKEEDWLDGI